MKITITMFNPDDETYEPVQLPARYDVCPTCDGHGVKCTIGAMTGSGYGESCYEDPQFAEDYRNGVYDAPCPECKGRRIITVVKEEDIPQHLKKRYEAHLADELEADMERRAEQQLRSRGIEY